MVSKPKPIGPFQEVAAGFCMSGGKQFLIIVDCYTDWSDVIPMGTNTTTQHLITTLHSMLCRTVPDILWTDVHHSSKLKNFPCLYPVGLHPPDIIPSICTQQQKGRVYVKDTHSILESSSP